VTRLQADDTWWLGVAVAAFAVISGQIVMVLGEAPPHTAWVQFVAITFAAATFPLMSQGAEQAMRWPLATVWLCAAAILLTAMFGPDVEGVRRWAGTPAVAIHVGHLVTPLAIGVAARRPGPWSASALAALSLGLALQPDAAGLIALTAALGGLLALERNRWTAAALAAAALATLWALLNPDTLAPVSWVEGMPATALSMELWLGFLVALGLCLMPMPFLFIAAQGRRRRPLATALAAYWLALIGASLVAAFPTPLVGYGVGPILGYVLSWALLRVGAPSARQR
jgi:cell division protein FtsW (lipid II flippase)